MKLFRNCAVVDSNNKNKNKDKSKNENNKHHEVPLSQTKLYSKLFIVIC